MTVSANGNEPFRISLPKALLTKALEAVFPSYNIIKIEREDYYNSPFFNFEENRRSEVKLRILTADQCLIRSDLIKKNPKGNQRNCNKLSRRKENGIVNRIETKTGTLLCLNVKKSLKKSKQNVF